MKISDYLEIVKIDQHFFHFKMKGFWGTKFVNELGDTLLKEFYSSVDSIQSESFILLADLTTFKTPSMEGKDLLGKMMSYCLENGLYKAVELVPQAIQKMAIDKTAKQVSKEHFRIILKNKDEALKKIEELKKELLQTT